MLADLYLQADHYTPALETIERLLGRPEARALSAWALSLKGRVAYREGSPDEARDLYEQSLALYRRVGDETGAAHVRNNLGLIHKHLCEWEAAVSHLKRALESHRRTGHLAETL